MQTRMGGRQWLEAFASLLDPPVCAAVSLLGGVGW